ncbi:MAG: hypothetical protein ABIP51_10385 [Bacteroidia bacterium]
MKKIFFVFSFLLVSNSFFSQSDTLYLAKGKKLICKITEINEFEIKCRLASNIDGPMYVMDRSEVMKYTLSNGFSEQFVRDEMLVENEHKSILNNRQVIKLSPFGLAFNHVSIGYESVIKVGMNLDVEAGYINSEINHNSIFTTNGSSGPLHCSGAYFKPGVKFFLGQDYAVKGLKYSHPLKGSYVRLDLAVSYVNFQDLSMVYFNYNNNPYGGAASTQTLYSNMNTIAYGGFVNYGRQAILGNILTMDYYVGAGFTGQTISYSNPNFLNSPFPNQTYNNSNQEKNYSYNYYGFLRVPNFGLSFTAGFRIGYIIPDRSQNKRRS